MLDDGTTIASAAASLDLAALRRPAPAHGQARIYVFNVDEATLADADGPRAARGARRPRAQSSSCARSSKPRSPGWTPADAAELLAEYGQLESGLAQLARVGFETLGLQTFLTAGPKEARAWTIRRGATAPEAAGVIHSDFETHFIKAEVVAYDDLVAAGSLTALRAEGKARIEGRDYVMREGDVVEFRVGV